MTGCAWCGGTPLTREHLLPAWLADVLQEAFPSPGGYNFAYEWVDQSGVGQPRAYSPARPELIVRAVCEPCNTGWMSSLEGQVRPFLTPMVQGTDARLEINEQGLLARWAAKVAVLLEHYEPDTIILADSDKHDIVNGSAPTGWHIRLALRGEERPPPLDFHLSNHYAAPELDAAERATQPNSFSVTLGIGRLAIAVVGGPGVFNPERWRQGSDLPLTIWPPTPRGLVWPPIHPVLHGHDDLTEFHSSFWDAVVNPNPPRADARRHLPN